MITRETGSGLMVAEHSQDEAAISRALKRIDSRLVLQKHPGDVPGGFVYKVLAVVSEDRPPEYVATWADELGNPLPLSTGLVALVESLRKESRGRRGVDADEANRRLVERNTRYRIAAHESLDGDHAAKIERSSVTVGMGARSHKPSWMRNSPMLRDLLKR